MPPASGDDQSTGDDRSTGSAQTETADAASDGSDGPRDRRAASDGPDDAAGATGEGSADGDGFVWGAAGETESAGPEGGFSWDAPVVADAADEGTAQTRLTPASTEASASAATDGSTQATEQATLTPEAAADDGFAWCEATDDGPDDPADAGRSGPAADAPAGRDDGASVDATEDEASGSGGTEDGVPGSDATDDATPPTPAEDDPATRAAEGAAAERDDGLALDPSLATRHRVAGTDDEAVSLLSALRRDPDLGRWRRLRREVGDGDDAPGDDEGDGDSQ
jgi:hypothetical protein